MRTSDEPEQWLGALRRALRGVRYGSVELVVHGGRVVLIERREKVRLDAIVPPTGRTGETPRTSSDHRDTGALDREQE